jgi:acyl carrier protein
MKALALTIAVKEKVRDYSIVAYERYREQSEKEKSWNQEGPRKKKGAYVLTVEECMPSYERENEEEVEEKTLTREDMENENSDEEEEHVLIQRTVSDSLSTLELQMNIASKFDAELRETEDGIKKCFLKQKTTSNVKTMVLGVVKCVQ